MTTIIFLHGGGMGGWVWEDIATALRQEGHKVLTPTFTGFGERSHLISREVTHDVHVQDIGNVLAFEDARDAVLVAYSYGGTVAPGAVAQAGDRIRRVIYLDGIVPEAGKSVMEAMGYMHGPEAAGLNSLLASGGGPIGTGVNEMQRKAAAEKPYKMTPADTAARADERHADARHGQSGDLWRGFDPQASRLSGCDWRRDGAPARQGARAGLGCAGNRPRDRPCVYCRPSGKTTGLSAPEALRGLSF
jgi:pimeloyl-ACP methyl ester carboxylesterase